MSLIHVWLFKVGVFVNALLEDLLSLNKICGVDCEDELIIIKRTCMALQYVVNGPVPMPNVASFIIGHKLQSMAC